MSKRCDLCGFNFEKLTDWNINVHYTTCKKKNGNGTINKLQTINSFLSKKRSKYQIVLDFLN